MQSEMFLVFGGYSSSTEHRVSKIAQYNPDTDTWTKLGDLINARNGHDIITTEGVFLVAGLGPTEKCQFEEDAMKCVAQEPIISRFD